MLRYAEYLRSFIARYNYPSKCNLQGNSGVGLTGIRSVYQTAICKYYTVQPHVDNANVPPQLTLVHSRKKIQKTNVAPNNHGKIVNIMFFPFNGLILWRYYCWWYTNLDLVGTNRRFFRTTITCPRWFPVVPRDSRNFSRDMRASTSGLGK